MAPIQPELELNSSANRPTMASFLASSLLGSLQRTQAYESSFVAIATCLSGNSRHSELHVQTPATNPGTSG